MICLRCLGLLTIFHLLPEISYGHRQEVQIPKERMGVLKDANHNFKCLNGTETMDKCDCREFRELSLCRMQPCLNGGQEIRRWYFCDGKFDCSDLSDECLCNKRREENFLTYDLCRDILTDNLDQHGGGCSIGEIKCPRVKQTMNKHACVEIKGICNGKVECGNSIDESLCRASNSPVLEDGRDNANTSIICDGIVDQPDGEDELNCSHYFYCSKNLKKFQCLFNNSRNNTDYFEDMCGGPAFIDWRKQFDGNPDCAGIEDEWHPNFVYCEDPGVSVSLPDRTRCPEAGEGTRIFSTPQASIDSLAFRILEWPIGLIGLIGNTIVAVHSLRCILRSTKRFSARNRRNAMADRRTSGTSLRYSVGVTKISNHLLVLFLCGSDIMMGIQILSMAISAVMFRGVYWQHDRAWQSSSTCVFVGTLAIFTTQSSALMIVVISLVRLYIIRHPFRIIRVKFVVCAAILTWIISVVLMILPMIRGNWWFEQYFVYSVEVPNSPQVEANVLERNTLEKYVRKIIILNGSFPLNFLLSDMRWDKLESMVRNINPRYAGWRYFGYYSQMGICIPPVIAVSSDPGWIYSLVLLCLDFIVFLVVILSYACIYVHTRRNEGRNLGCSCLKKLRNRRVQSESTAMYRNPAFRTHDEEDKEMQTRILLIIGTDFACWAPACILTFFSAFYPILKNDITILTVMLLIQLNSMVNPLVYSKTVRHGLSRFLWFCRDSIQYWVMKIFKREELNNQETRTSRSSRVGTDHTTPDSCRAVFAITPLANFNLPNRHIEDENEYSLRRESSMDATCTVSDHTDISM